MQTTDYTIIGLQEIAKEKLSPHPAAQIPIDQEDQESLRRTIIEDGLVQPLLVMEDKDHRNQFLIVDGCNRFEQSKELRSSFPCLVIETDDPRRVVLTCLSGGRKRTTGQRIIAFLEQHKAEVLSAWRINSGKGENYRKTYSGGYPPLDSEATTIRDYSAAGIGEHLRCDRKEVAKLIELLVTLDTGKYTDGQEHVQEVDEEMRKAIELQRTKVYQGSPTWRRWKSAVQGPNNDNKGRADAEYQRLICLAASTLREGFPLWSQNKIKWDTQFTKNEALKRLKCVFEALPDAVRSLFVETLLATWKLEEKKYLAKALAASIKKTKNEKKQSK
jgi:hypothetical protein